MPSGQRHRPRCETWTPTNQIETLRRRCCWGRCWDRLEISWRSVEIGGGDIEICTHWQSQMRSKWNDWLIDWPRAMAVSITYVKRWNRKCSLCALCIFNAFSSSLPSYPPTSPPWRNCWHCGRSRHANGNSTSAFYKYFSLFSSSAQTYFNILQHCFLFLYVPKPLLQEYRDMSLLRRPSWPTPLCKCQIGGCRAKAAIFPLDLLVFSVSLRKIKEKLNAMKSDKPQRRRGGEGN